MMVRVSERAFDNVNLGGIAEVQRLLSHVGGMKVFFLFPRSVPARQSFICRSKSNILEENQNEKQHDENFPDPFKGKVKRTYIYIEFNDINHVDSIIYQYCDSENDEAVKKAAVQIFNSKKDRGKISIDKNKYRYLLKYNPPKDNYSIVFLDRTLEISTINRLLFIFIII